MVGIFDNLEYVKMYVLFEDTNSIRWYDIDTGKANNIVAVSNKSFDQYVTLIANYYTLKYNGNELKLTCLSGKPLDDIDDPNITEEMFFQLSTIKNFGALEYVEIEFIKEVFTRCFKIN